jgi:hypothetical protein
VIVCTFKTDTHRHFIYHNSDLAREHASLAISTEDLRFCEACCRCRRWGWCSDGGAAINSFLYRLAVIVFSICVHIATFRRKKRIFNPIAAI